MSNEGTTDKVNDSVILGGYLSFLTSDNETKFGCSNGGYKQAKRIRGVNSFRLYHYRLVTILDLKPPIMNCIGVSRTLPEIMLF